MRIIAYILTIPLRLITTLLYFGLTTIVGAFIILGDEKKNRNCSYWTNGIIKDYVDIWRWK